jgi:hypothetical protein
VYPHSLYFTGLFFPDFDYCFFPYLHGCVHELADREAAGGGLLSAEPRLEGVSGAHGRDGGDGAHGRVGGRKKYVLFVCFCFCSC